MNLGHSLRFAGVCRSRPPKSRVTRTFAFQQHQIVQHHLTTAISIISTKMLKGWIHKMLTILAKLPKQPQTHSAAKRSDPTSPRRLVFPLVSCTNIQRQMLDTLEKIHRVKWASDQKQLYTQIDDQCNCISCTTPTILTCIHPLEHRLPRNNPTRHLK